MNNVQNVAPYNIKLYPKKVHFFPTFITYLLLLYFEADVMKQLGANSIFAVDVGSRESTEIYNYGDQISGFWLLANKWSPWHDTVKVL